MSIGAYSVRTPVISWLVIVIMVAGGIFGFQKMGKLEDPAFTIKMAKIITQYPGASAQEVYDEVTYHLEDAIQKLPQLKRLKMSVSRPGLSDITIEFKDEYGADELPNVFDELRRKISDVTRQLPPGALAPVVIDDFGDVYGVYLMITGEGYSWRDLYDVADDIKRQLVLVEGVRKVSIDGEQQEVVYLDMSRVRLAELGIDPATIAGVLGSQNSVVDAGNVRVGDDYLRIKPTGEFDSVQEIGNVLISSRNRDLVALKDIATITRAYQEVPVKLYYHNGLPALSVGISMAKGQNVVEAGKRLQARIDDLQTLIPVGMSLEAVYDQPAEVEESVSGFVMSVAQAVIIVIAVLLLFMGLRSGLIIGSVLLITVSGTLLLMYLFGIELQRISLGALVIALGMLVDNAIVVAEGMQVRMQSGMKAIEAATEAVGKTIWALLGGTAIGILAFSAIGLSPDNTGEFAGSLFYVILISLSLSWITAVSTTPLLCSLLLKPGGPDQVQNPYGGKLFLAYRSLVAFAVNHRWFTVALVGGLFALGVVGFGQVKSGFFPASSTPLFFVDIYEPEGTDIRKTRDDTLEVSDFLRQQPGVLQTTAVIGGAHQRFTLVYDAREPTPVYSQIIVRTETPEQVEALQERVAEKLRRETPWIDPIVKSLRIGPGRDAKIEARFSGPDATVLRQLSEQAEAIMRNDAEAVDIRNDWRSPVKLVTPVFNEQVGRQLGISREALGDAMKSAFDGLPAGSYRDRNRVLPLRMRATENERNDVNSVRDVQIWSAVLGQTVPATAVISGYRTDYENAVLRSRNRIATIIASCNPRGELATPLFERIRPQIEAIELPPGYELSWGGEYEDNANAQEGLGRSLPVGILLMILTSIVLFGKLRQPLIIWLTVPLAIVGISAGLLATNGAFDFMSLLGALSLIGLLIKNAIVLIEEIDQQIAEGNDPYEAVLDSAVSRARPVVLASGTTILGLIPLLSDVFFVNMSVTIMAGLGFASILTLTVVPTLYATFFNIRKDDGEGAPESDAPSVESSASA
ncbi:efflux RND transporter permease subunit [Congregibacter litoralis]|uniref:Cation/multidrug efflux pump n=1 Tax=Congregibacter litoralis KT71 TaxID=314285 RepID=A4A4H3_9GAMM|nr:efflux RND transporter permease subunit [Congregibacter litoralis]EAQ99106.1 Cation/multidrug efflux pump [Congregibacter litoralis KT71]